MTYGYEPTTNRRNQIQSTMGGSGNVIAEFNPSYDPRGLMQNVTPKGSAFADYYTASYSSVLNNRLRFSIFLGTGHKLVCRDSAAP